MTKGLAPKLACAGLGLMLASLSACDVDRNDIALDPRKDAGVSGSGGRYGETSGAKKPDSGPSAGSAAPPRFPDEKPEGTTKPGADRDAAFEPSPMDAGMDAAMDAGPEAGPDAQPATAGMGAAGARAGGATAGADPDSGADDCDGDICDDPCRNGRFRCALARVLVKADYWIPAPTPTARAQVDGYTFEATGADGVVELWLPTDVLLHLYLSSPGFWRTDLLLRFPHTTDVIEGPTYVLSDAILQDYFGRAGQTVDDSKGVAMFTFDVARAGEGVTLNHSSSPGLVANEQWDVTASETLLADSAKLVNFANLEPGPFTPTVISPPGFQCLLGPEDGAEFEASPRTVISASILCVPEP